MPHAKQCQSPKMIKFVPFEEYSKKYTELFTLERSESGVVTAKFHTDGGPAEWDYPLHRGIGQLCHDIGQDADTEVLILGGTGDIFLKGKENVSLDDSNIETQRWMYYEHSYYDGCNMLEGIVNDVEQPTIGVINGSALHSEIALMCDITIMAEDAIIFDPHYFLGGIPGDGIQIGLRYAMGPKRANYAMLMNQVIDAKTALEYGMVNEVVPKEKLYERAQEIGEYLAAKPRLTRRVTTQITRQQLKGMISQELRPTFGTEMWAMMAIMGSDEGTKNHGEASVVVAKEMKDKYGREV